MGQGPHEFRMFCRIAKVQGTEQFVVSLGSRLNMRKKPDRADFECLQDFGSAKRGEIRAVSWM